MFARNARKTLFTEKILKVKEGHTTTVLRIYILGLALNMGPRGARIYNHTYDIRQETNSLIVY